VFKYKDLLIELVKREIKARYKQSILGYAWVVLVPLINLVVLSIVFSFFIRVPTGGIPYPIFLFVALVPWLFTTHSISFATKSLLNNKSLITKIYLPREIFPISSILARAVDLTLYTMLLFIFMLVFKVGISSTVLFIPMIFFVQFMLLVGISLILSATNVFYRDVENLLEVALTAWMYLTSIVYPPELVPAQYRFIFNLNPMTPIINSYRNVILYKVPPPWQSFCYATIISLAIFIIGVVYFRKRSRYFADVI
jgi:lipopolysaccharide transport system permease protein